MRAGLYREEALGLLDRVGMADNADRPCSELAYGDVKRVELAIALAGAPKLLLMDEPTAGMAPKERAQLMELTAGIARERRIGVLFTEHDMDAVFGHADDVLVLVRGEIIASGRPEEVRANAAGAAGVSGRSFGTSSGAPRRAGRVRRAMGDGAILEVEDLSAAYGQAQILFDVSLKLARGEIVALMGRNGAGKSTTLKAIMGLVPGACPALRFCRPRHRGHLPTYRIARLGLGYVPEDRRIFTDLTVYENLEVGTKAALPMRAGAMDARAPVLDLPQPGRDARPPRQPDVGRRAADAHHRPHADGQPRGGAARRAFRGPGAGDRRADGRGRARMKAEGIAVLLSEQNLHFASAVADRTYIIEKGAIRHEGRMADIAADAALREAYLAV